MEYGTGRQSVQGHEVKELVTDLATKDYWFDDCLQAELLSAAAVKELYQNINNIVFSTGSKAKFKHLYLDQNPRIVMCSVPRNDGPAEIFLGNGLGILSAITQAMNKVLLAYGSLEKIDWLKIDVVTTVKPSKAYLYPEKLDIDRSVEGLAFQKKTTVALLPEQLVANSYMSAEGKVQMKRIIKKFPQLNIDGNKIFTFKTRSFFVSRSIIVPLVRGSKCFYDIEPDALIKSVTAAGQYLISAVKEDGSFLYSYRPKQNKETKKYNILRHAGTIYSMLELYEVNAEKALLEKSKIAIQYLVEQIHFKNESSKRLAFVVENGFIKLGGSALAALALCKFTKITGDPQYLEIIEQLGHWIQSVQAESGEFFVHKQSYPEGEISSFISDYYPGEALFALCRIYELLPKPEWLDAAERGAKWLINVRDEDVTIKTVNHDHWLLYALNELYRLRPNEIYLNHAFLISDSILKAQHKFHKYPDWNGGFYTPPRSTPTAVRIEGLCAAYRLAKDFDFDNQADKMIGSIKLGVAFQLQTQFQPVNVMYLKNPKAALGGFKRSLTMYEVRIDYVQHNVSSILALYQILL